MPLKKSVLTLLSATLLFGCSAFDDDDNASSKTSLSGKVADGYLQGARVCLDLNSNKVCDDGEPATVSESGGVFNLAGVTQQQLDSAPLLVEVIVGETIDEDNPGTTIDKKYTLTAPAGYEFISPLTTMVQSEIEDKGISAEEAKGAVQVKLGTTLDLEDDYVAGSESGGDAAEFERLHKVAQVTTVVLQNNIETVEQVLAGADVSFEDLVGVIVAQVLEALDEISTQVDAAGGSFDPDALAQSDTLAGANVNPATVEEEIAEREAERLTEAVNLAEVLAAGDSLHFFESDNDQSGIRYFYGTVAPGSGNTVVLNQTQYNSDNSQWESQSEDGGNDTYQICVLANNSWNCIDEDNETIVVENGAVVVKNGDLAITATEITGVSVDLSGKRISSFLGDDYYKVLDLRADFAAGANGYKLSFKRVEDLYAIFRDNPANVADCWSDDESGSSIQVGQPWNPTDTWCNNVFLVTGDGNHENDGNPATSLDQLISSSAAANPNDRADIKGTPIYGRDLEVMAEFVQGGIANYYLIEHNEGQPSTLGDKIVASWEQVSVQGKSLLKFALPGVLAELGDLDPDERLQFFTIESGYVRRGGIELAGERGDGNDWVFNNAGRDQVLTAFDYSLQEDLAICSSEDVDYDEDNVAQEPGATAAEFVTAASNCGTSAFTTNELVGMTLVTDFGFLTFKENGAGTFYGEVGENQNAVLTFSWSLDSGRIVVNAQADVDGTTEYLRLTLAKMESNARQISLLSFGQDATSSAGLDSGKGDIRGELWDLN